MRQFFLPSLVFLSCFLNAEVEEEFYDFDEELAFDEIDYEEYNNESYDENADFSSKAGLGWVADQDDSYQNSQGVECRSPFHMMHVAIRHTEARGVGYHDGYTTLEGYGIHNHNSYFMPFLDLRGHVFNDGKLAGNIGLGARSVIPKINHFLGVYCYYDVRQDNHGLTVNQLSPGIELISKRMEYRMNGYFPVGNNKSRRFNYAFDRFNGHHILLRYKRKSALTGGDAEVAHTSRKALGMTSMQEQAPITFLLRMLLLGEAKLAFLAGIKNTLRLKLPILTITSSEVYFKEALV